MTAKPAYRAKGMRCLERAKQELASGADHRLVYAALELRMAIEAVTYDRAYAYENDLPAAAWKEWQPKKFMEVLLQLDPGAGSGSGLRAVLTPKDGEAEDTSPPFEGVENVLSLATIKRHYNALGSFLHVQTRDKFDAGEVAGSDKLRARCGEIIAALEEVFRSSMWNMRGGIVLEFDCQKCGLPMVKTAPFKYEKTTVTCLACDATYELTPDGNEQMTNIDPISQELECPWEDCKAKYLVWKSDVKVGNTWKCPECQGRMHIGLGVGRIEGSRPALEPSPTEP